MVTIAKYPSQDKEPCSGKMVCNYYFSFTDCLLVQNKQKCFDTAMYRAIIYILCANDNNYLGLLMSFLMTQISTFCIIFPMY